MSEWIGRESQGKAIHIYWAPTVYPILCHGAFWISLPLIHLPHWGRGSHPCRLVMHPWYPSDSHGNCSTNTTDTLNTVMNESLTNFKESLIVSILHWGSVTQCNLPRFAEFFQSPQPLAHISIEKIYLQAYKQTWISTCASSLPPLRRIWRTETGVRPVSPTTSLFSQDTLGSIYSVLWGIINN